MTSEFHSRMIRQRNEETEAIAAPVLDPTSKEYLDSRNKIIEQLFKSKKSFDNGRLGLAITWGSDLAGAPERAFLSGHRNHEGVHYMLRVATSIDANDTYRFNDIDPKINLETEDSARAAQYFGLSLETQQLLLQIDVDKELAAASQFAADK